MKAEKLTFSHGVQDHWHELPDEDFGPSCRKQPSTESPSVLKATTTCTSGGPFLNPPVCHLAPENTRGCSFGAGGPTPWAGLVRNGECVGGDKMRIRATAQKQFGQVHQHHFSTQLYLLGLPQNQGVDVHEAAQNTAVRPIPSKPGVWLGAWVQRLERDLVPVPPAKIVWPIPGPRGLTSVGCHKRSDDRRGFTQWPRHGSLGGALPWLAPPSEALPSTEGDKKTKDMSRRSRYYRYLESGHWKTLMLSAFKRDGFKCVRCGSSTDLRGHHKRYRKDIRSCTVDDIETLCEKCHDKHHKDKARQRKLNRGPRQYGLVRLICMFGDNDFTPLVPVEKQTYEILL